MDREEVDIGTIRGIEGRPWVSQHLQVEAETGSTRAQPRRLVSSSAPDIVNSVTAQQRIPPENTLSLPPTIHKAGSASEHDLPLLDGETVASIRRWILALAIGKYLDFDLDLGPVLTCLCPPLTIPQDCRENVAFSAFPDSSTFETGSQIHSFKLTGLPTSAGIQPEAYAFSYFVQQRDPTSKRGYLQRSIVVLSQHPYPSLFEEIASILGPLYVAHGRVLLETACQSISSWPDPSHDTPLELGFLGHALRINLPRTDDETQFQETSKKLNPSLQILASVPPNNPSLVSIFSTCLPSLWSIWELLILCEPVLIYGPNPRITSLAVWWLRDLLRPIPIIGDFRPYITIHDRDYSALVNKYPPKAGLVVGVTNPFVLSVTKHWPHVVSLSVEGQQKKRSRSLPDNANSKPNVGYSTQTHKRYTSKDRPLLKTWEDALQAGGHLERTASETLRRHFSSRTASFLAPLSRYLNSLIPTPAETNALSKASPRSKGRLKPFNNAQFLASLKANGTPLPFRSSTKRKEFYERWLRTPAFGLWLAKQEDVVVGVLKDNAARGGTYG
ncbi:hypothetical protein M422DRAFT_243278 [Sphaerobolus stellatus SS14]|nr:hypothetical protein M422DRAFT_243278 [Sphaerobolus stellatus SS14]